MSKLPRSPIQTEPRPSSAALLGVLVILAAWTFPGLVGHDPWKQDEAYSFGIIYNMVRTGDLVVPTLAADPFMEKPPAYYITATGMVHLLDGLLLPHDAARLTTALYLAIIFLFTGLLAKSTWGEGHGVLGVLMLISTLGLMQHGHFMITDIALSAGMAMAFYGLLLARKRAGWGGLWLGTGAGLAFMSKGLLGPGILGVSALVLPVLFAPWRSRTYLMALLIAAAAVLPWVLVWPTALYLRDPDLFKLWYWDNNFGRYLGFVELGPPVKDLFWLRTFPWVTFPVSLLALWTLWARRNDVRVNDGVRATLVVSLVGWGVLFAAHTGRDLYSLPLLAPLAIIAAGGLRDLPRWVVTGAYWISASLFALLAVVLWAIWLYGLSVGHPPRLSLLERNLAMDFEPTWSWVTFLAALALQISWTLVVIHYRPPRSSALLAWPLGLILAWGLVSTLHLPWIDQGKSYRGIFTELAQALPENYNCIADLEEMRVRESERGMLHYVAGITTVHIDRPEDTECNIILVEARIRLHGSEVDLGPGWRRIWEGQRPADRRDLFILFHRVENPAGESAGSGL